MDLLNIQKAIDKLNDETLPRLETLIQRDLKIAVDEIHGLLDRLDGIQISGRVDVPPRGSVPSTS